jgi:hypothetical protein
VAAAAFLLAACLGAVERKGADGRVVLSANSGSQLPLIERQEGVMKEISGRFAMTAAITMAGLVFAPAGHADQTNAAALLARATAVMDPAHQLRQLAGVQSRALVTSNDVVEFDHADAPYLQAGVSRVSATEDVIGDRRLVEESVVGASEAAGPRTRSLLHGDLQQTDSVAAGRPAVTTLLEAPAAWRTGELIHLLVLAGQAGDLAEAADVSLHGIPQHVLTFHDGVYPVKLYLNAETALPSAAEVTLTANRAVSSDIAWDGWGDLTDRTEWMNYDLADGVRYPLQSDVFRNGVHLRTVVRAEVHISRKPYDEGIFAMEASSGPVMRLRADEVALAQPIRQAPDPKKPIAEIAPGIVQIPGSWYSTIVRQPDGLVIIDAPISPGYSRRVLDEAARRFPDLPVKAVITSTAFYWHIAGIREYAARGIPIYVRDRNVDVVRALLAAPHTLAPDDLARSPSAVPVIRPVSAATHIGQGTHAITVFPITHGEQPMLMSLIADAHLLHTAEMVQPLGPQASLLFPEALVELKLSVRDAGVPTQGLRMIGMHMSPTPWTELDKRLAQP